MQIPLSFQDAERLIASLGLSIADLVAEAGSDAERTFEQMREASAYAHVLARLLDRLTEALAGKTPIVLDETDEQAELRLAVAARKVTPIRPDGAA